MPILAAISVAAMLLISLAVGGRLLMTARRTRQIPELFFGCGFLFIGLGLGLQTLGSRFLWVAPGETATVMATLLFGMVVAGVVSLHAAVWRIFRPDHLPGFLSFAGGSVLALVAYGMRIGAGEFAEPVVASAGMKLFFCASISVFTWGAIEAIHLHFRLRKQVRLGLAEPLAANQIGLWGVAASLSAVMTVVVGYDLLELRRSPLDDPVSTGLLVTTVLGASGAMWCAFFPPPRLRARLSATG